MKRQMNALRRIGFALLICQCAALLAPAARADYAVLRAGQRLHINGYLRQGSKILFYISGGSVVVDSAEVVRFEPEDTFTPAPAPAADTTNVPFSAQIRTAAAQNGVDAKLVSSVIAAESNFNSRTISSKHAMGLMQLMPRTAAGLAVRNPFDPAQNINAGTRYLKQLLDQYHGNLSLALAAYNAGPATVAQYGGVPPFPATRKYVRNIKRKLNPPQSATTAPLAQ